LHHHPTRGGHVENTRHHEQYNRTLASYRAHFGEDPPADIWPPAEIRFGEDLDHVRVSRARNWIISKPRLWHASTKASTVLLTSTVAPLLIGVTSPLEMTGPEFLALYGIVTAMVIVASIVVRRWLRTDEPVGDVTQLEPEEVACLGRGAAGVLQSCLAGLVAGGRMRVIEKPGTKLGPVTIGTSTYRLKSCAPAESANSWIERAMLLAGQSADGAEAAEILKHAKPVAEQVESKLQSRGLLETSESFGPARWWPIIMIAGLIVFGLVKLIVGLSRGKPIVFLAIWLVALVVVMILFGRKPLRTIRGAQLLKDLKSRHENLKLKDFSRPGNFSAADTMLVAGLFGIVAVPIPEVLLLQSALKPVPSRDGGLAGSSGGCSGGCSNGGGCGGGGCGGGGCGGCGGGD
jgi:uncharacterized protein (TIGR04222 family)